MNRSKPCLAPSERRGTTRTQMAAFATKSPDRCAPGAGTGRQAQRLQRACGGRPNGLRRVSENQKHARLRALRLPQEAAIRRCRRPPRTPARRAATARSRVERLGASTTRLGLSTPPTVARPRTQSAVMCAPWASPPIAGGVIASAARTSLTARRAPSARNLFSGRTTAAASGRDVPPEVLGRKEPRPAQGTASLILRRRCLVSARNGPQRQATTRNHARDRGVRRFCPGLGELGAGAGDHL
jgi:hypothetical protein